MFEMPPLLLEMPPLLDDEGNPERWYGIKFSNGFLSIEITDEGGGAYLIIEAEEPWKISTEELFAFAEWAKKVVAAVDEHNATTT